MPASRDPLASQIEQFESAVERIPNIDESVKKSLTTTLSTEARIILQKEDDKSKVQQLLKTQTLILDEAVSPMPWSQLTESEAKIISQVVENIKQQDFSTKSLKHWSVHFSDVFDKFFISSRVGRIAVIYNSCSTSLKQRLLALDVGQEAQKDSYSYLSLLQLITTVVHSPVSKDEAMINIYTKVSVRLVQNRFSHTCRKFVIRLRKPTAPVQVGQCHKRLSCLRRYVRVYVPQSWLN